MNIVTFEGDIFLREDSEIHRQMNNNNFAAVHTFLKNNKEP